MSDLIGIAVFMAIVVGIAAGILYLVDRLTLPRGLSEEERRAIVAKRTRRARRAWAIFYLSCAAIALVVNVINPEHESLRSRLSWSLPAAIVVILFLLSSGKGDARDKNQE
jgi:peptidoglycan/LPS O-acetylase OafA/YrhL